MTLPRTEAPSPDALASLGKIRETLAAARNLEHLVLSRSVGPKVLAQVIPDVSLALSCYELETRALVDSLAYHYSENLSDLDSMSRLGVLEVEALVRLLGQLAEGPLNAKPRLELERQLRQTLPPLLSAVAHWELLAESAASDCVVLSVAEFLSSAPERSSDRPHRSVPVRGDLQRLFVEVPPRVGLRCLSAWLGHRAVSVQKGEREGLFVAAADELVVLSREPSSSYQLMLNLPLFVCSPQTEAIVAAALRLHGAGLCDGTLSLKKVTVEA